MQIQHITVTDYHMSPPRDSVKGGYVQYTLIVQAKTVYLHSSAYYDHDACLFTDCPAFTIFSRFRQLNQLHRELQAFHTNLQLPDFPPKRWLRNKQEAFLRERMSQLCDYFHRLLELEPLQTSPLLCDFCRPVLELNLAIAGCPEVGKMRLLEAFLNYSPKASNAELPDIQHRKPSNQDPSQFTYPLDMIIRKTLLRITSIHLVALTDDTTAEALAQSYHGIVFTYSNEVEGSYAPIKRLRPACAVASVVVGLDQHGDTGFASYSAEWTFDAFEVFEKLIGDILSYGSPSVLLSSGIY